MCCFFFCGQGDCFEEEEISRFSGVVFHDDISGRFPVLGRNTVEVFECDVFCGFSFEQRENNTLNDVGKLGNMFLTRIVVSLNLQNCYNIRRESISKK